MVLGAWTQVFSLATAKHLYPKPSCWLVFRGRASLCRQVVLEHITLFRPTLNLQQFFLLCLLQTGITVWYHFLNFSEARYHSLGWPETSTGAQAGLKLTMLWLNLQDSGITGMHYLMWFLNTFFLKKKKLPVPLRINFTTHPPERKLHIFQDFHSR
jgi:hypothetical protein